METITTNPRTARLLANVEEAKKALGAALSAMRSSEEDLATRSRTYEFQTAQRLFDEGWHVSQIYQPYIEDSGDLRFDATTPSGQKRRYLEDGQLHAYKGDAPYDPIVEDSYDGDQFQYCSNENPAVYLVNELGISIFSTEVQEAILNHLRNITEESGHRF